MGETLLGLIDHHCETTGDGVNLSVPFDYAVLGPDARPSGAGELTETRATVGDPGHGDRGFGRRYLLRNFLHDAGVAGPLAEADVCAVPATQPTTACG